MSKKSSNFATDYRLSGLLMRLRLLTILLLSTLAMHAVRFTDIAKANCQLADSAAGTVTLIFATDSAHFALPVDSILGVYVSGSINDLQDMTDAYELNQFSDDSCYYHTFTCDQLAKPGNSGQPEFVFFVLKQDSSTANYYAFHQRKAQIDSRLLIYNGIPYTMIILPCGADYFTRDLDELGARGDEARVIRPLSDFQLTDSTDQHRIANFRRVPATVNLYRSYHPYCPSVPQYDTEAERLHWVGELATQAGIGSVLSLTGNRESMIGTTYVCGGDSFVVTMPVYLQQIINRGDMYYVGSRCGVHPIDVQCYYHSEDSLFALWMKDVVEFIADEQHPMPVQIHCAIGADRTGMVCATLAVLCGADWQDIMADYSETGNMKIQTYRHPNRLRYAMTRMTGLNPDQCTNAQLAAAIRDHFVAMKMLTNDQIDAMIRRLKGESPLSVERVVGTATRGCCYDLLGRQVSRSASGILIQSDGSCRVNP